MDKSVLIRDTIIQKLKDERAFNGLVSAELDGNFLSAADIALPNNAGGSEVYRIAVVKHSPKKSYT